METFCEALFGLSQGKLYAVIVLSLWAVLFLVGALSSKNNSPIVLATVALSVLMPFVVFFGC